MNENSSTLHDPIQAENVFEFELPPLFAGIIAKEYQNGSTTRGIPMRGWGSSETSTSVEHEGRKYLAAPHRINGVPGLRIQVDDLVTNTRKSYWVPWSNLDTMTVLIRGMVEL